MCYHEGFTSIMDGIISTECYRCISVGLWVWHSVKSPIETSSLLTLVNRHTPLRTCVHQILSCSYKRWMILFYLMILNFLSRTSLKTRNILKCLAFSFPTQSLTQALFFLIQIFSFPWRLFFNLGLSGLGQVDSVNPSVTLNMEA